MKKDLDLWLLSKLWKVYHHHHTHLLEWWQSRGRKLHDLSSAIYRTPYHPPVDPCLSHTPRLAAWNLSGVLLVAAYED